MGWLSKMFSGKPTGKAAAPTDNAITDNFQPTKGTFFRTLEYPETDANGAVIGKMWLESGYVPENKAWVLWQKSIREMDDILRGGKSPVLSARPLFEKTSFANAYAQMTTFETARENLGEQPLPHKSRAKLGDQFLERIRLIAKPLPEFACHAVLVSGPVRQLVRLCRGVAFSIAESVGRRQLYEISRGRIEGTVSAMTEYGSRSGKELLSIFK